MAKRHAINVGDVVYATQAYVNEWECVTYGKGYVVTSLDEDGDPWFDDDEGDQSYLINDDGYCEIERVEKRQ